MAHRLLRVNNVQVRRALRRERVFRSPAELLENLSDFHVRQRFRFSRETLLYLADLLHDDLSRLTRRNNALTPMAQLMAACSFFGCGSFQYACGAVSNLSQPSVCRAVRAVSEALTARANQFIQFPSDAAEINLHKMQFANLATADGLRPIPNVVALIDATHVRIVAPSDNEHEYVNRKNFHSINVQAMTDSNGKCVNLVAQYPGRCHDSWILRNSGIFREFEARLHNNCIVLGDSGYPLLTWLLTPVLNARTRPEFRYNRTHRRVRVQVEQMFGRIKRRFHCLHAELRIRPERACSVIAACFVLFNIGIMRQEEEFDDDDLPDDDNDDGDDGQNPVLATGRALRAQLIRDFFT